MSSPERKWGLDLEAIHIQQKSLDGVNLPLQGEIIYIIKLHSALSAKGYHDSHVFLFLNDLSNAFLALYIMGYK